MVLNGVFFPSGSQTDLLEAFVPIGVQTTVWGRGLKSGPPAEQEALPNEGHILAVLEWAEPDSELIQGD